MKIVLFFLVLGFSLPAFAQDTLRKPVKDTAATYFIKLYDNTNLSGKIIERKGHEILFNDISIGRVTIPYSKIESMLRQTGSQYCIVTTNDGNTFTGILESQNEKELTLKTESLGTLNIGNGKIKEIKIVEKNQIVDGRYYFPNPLPTRYFFSPSAIPLKKGEGYFQNAEILVNGVQIGVTDHFSIGGGVIVPFMFFISPKVGYKVAANVHVGGGVWVASSVFSSQAYGLGVGYGSVTIGSNENNFTVNFGWGAVRSGNSYNSGSSWDFAKQPMFSLSGINRVSRKCALVTENWFFSKKKYDFNTGMTKYEYQAILSGGVRIMGQNNSFDIALVLPIISNQRDVFGLPYFSYVYKF